MTVKNMFSRMLNFVKPSRTAKRWSKASQAKNHVKHILRDLENDKNATKSVGKCLESSLKNPITEELAGDIYEQLSYKWALDLIQGFCKCILDNFPLLVKECSFAALPQKVQEAVASLVFASRRCKSMRVGKRMELLRELFRERYAPCGGEDEEVMECKVHARLRNKYLCGYRVADGVEMLLSELVAIKFVPQKEYYEEEQDVERGVAGAVYDDEQELSTDQESYEEHELSNCKFVLQVEEDEEQNVELSGEGAVYDDEQELSTDQESDEEHELSSCKFVLQEEEDEEQNVELSGAGAVYDDEQELSTDRESDEKHELSSCKFALKEEEYEEEQNVELSSAGTDDDEQELSTDRESDEEQELSSCNFVLQEEEDEEAQNVELNSAETDDDDEQELSTDRESDEEHELSSVETNGHDNEDEEEREMNAGQEHDEEHELSSVETGDERDNDDEEKREMKADEEHQLSVETDDDSEVEEQLSDQERQEQKFGNLLIDLSWVWEFERYRKHTIYLGRQGQQV